MSIYKILVVEDQEATLEALINAVTSVMVEFFPKNSISIAKWYGMAKELIEEESYDLVLLDHRMPYDNPGCTDRDSSFSRKCQDVGYRLIPLIREKNPNALIIGTSSLDRDELEDYSSPDYHISKMWGEASKELQAILERIKNQ